MPFEQADLDHADRHHHDQETQLRLDRDLAEPGGRLQLEGGKISYHVSHCAEASAKSPSSGVVISDSMSSTKIIRTSTGAKPDRQVKSVFAPKSRAGLQSSFVIDTTS